MVKSRGKERDAPLRESSNTRPAEPSWERKQEMGREGAIWGPHSNEMNQSSHLVWEAGIPLGHCRCDIVDKLLFLFGPQFLCVSSSERVGLEGPWNPLIRFNSLQGRRRQQQTVFLPSSLVSCSPVF